LVAATGTKAMSSYAYSVFLFLSSFFSSFFASAGAAAGAAAAAFLFTTRQ
jgi:hypothetical protein